jgi:hypothetical protein
MRALKTVAVALGITLGALIVIPLIVLAGLFVWLKDRRGRRESLELDREAPDPPVVSGSWRVGACAHSLTAASVRSLACSAACHGG